MTAPGTHELVVPPDAALQRVDRYVADVTGLSRSHVQKLITAGNLTTDGVPIKANAVVGPGAALQLIVPEPAPLDVAAEPDIDVRIVYEDVDLLIIDKPAGLVVHPSPGHSSGTLVNALLGLEGGGGFGGIAGVPGTVLHRGRARLFPERVRRARRPAGRSVVRWARATVPAHESAADRGAGHGGRGRPRDLGRGRRADRRRGSEEDDAGRA